MAIQRTLNSTGFGGNHFMHCVKTAAKAAGWTVSRGGTGTGGAFREDGVDPFSGWAPGDSVVLPELGVGNCWFCLKDPAGNREFLFMRRLNAGSASDGYWWVGYSPSGAYSGGDETTKPTAADEVSVSVSGSKATPASVHVNGTTANIVHVAADDAASPHGEYGLIAVEIKATNTTQAALVIDDLRQVATGDTDALSMGHAGVSFGISNWYRYTNRIVDPLASRLYTSCVPGLTYGGSYYYVAGRASEIDGIERPLPVLLVHVTAFGYQGFSRWFYQPAVARGYPNTGDSLSGMYFDQSYIPDFWDGASVPLTI